eukprot:gb/GECG01002601.1/.p1 GENE.gb/GECG01002601.1/~~gb/GECG01002601.1/.p1  ORF type:complete len:552 (+),score=57.94 gb/GECG01002601.1/:1-1656(+)
MAQRTEGGESGAPVEHQRAPGDLYEEARQLIAKDEKRFSGSSHRSFIDKVNSRFMDWCRDVAISDLSQIKWPVEFPDTGRGVAAAQKIDRDQQVLNIPRSVVITIDKAEKALRRSVPEETFEEMIENDVWMLSVFLLDEYFKCGRKPWQTCLSGSGDGASTLDEDILEPTNRSFWFQFLCALPPLHHLKDFPELWSEQELDNCRNPALRDQAERTREETVQQYYKTARRTELSFGDNLEWLDFLWMTLCVKSRVFLDLLEDDDEGLFSGAMHMLPVCIVPLADMLNHNQTKENLEASWVEATSKDEPTYTVVASTGIEEKEELCLSYGEESASYFLETYGFIDEGQNERLEHASVRIRTRTLEDNTRQFIQEQLHTELYPGHEIISKASPSDRLLINVPVFSSVSEFIHQTLPIMRLIEQEEIRNLDNSEWTRSPVDTNMELKCLRSLRTAIDDVILNISNRGRAVVKSYVKRMKEILTRYKQLINDVEEFTQYIQSASKQVDFVDAIKTGGIRNYLGTDITTNWVALEGPEGRESLNGYLIKLFQCSRVQ